MIAVVRAALVPVRAEPSVRAEQVSQEPLGAVLEVQERREDWVRVRGEDDYEGWVNVGGLVLSDSEDLEAWWDRFRARPTLVLDAALADEVDGAVVRLPWGARVAVDGEVTYLPDGRRGRLVEGTWVAWADVGGRFPQTGSAVLATARGWLGVPYLWGGRTRWGVDCSGLVQAVYRLHGLLLPRDSCDQATIGQPIEAGTDLTEVQVGDLLFFRAADSERIVHVGLSTGGSALVHAAQPNGEVRENDLAADSPFERALASRLAGVRRVVG